MTDKTPISCQQQFIERRQQIMAASDEGLTLYGLSDSTINAMETALAFTLPEVYKDFLRVMGDAERSNYSLGIYPSSVINAVERITLECKENSGLALVFPANSLVLREFDDEIYWFVVCDGNQDPAVVIHTDHHDGVIQSNLDSLHGMPKDFFVANQTLSEFLFEACSRAIWGIKHFIRKRPMDIVSFYEPWATSATDLANALSAISNDIVFFIENEDVLIKKLYLSTTCYGLLSCAAHTKLTDTNAAALYQLLQQVPFTEDMLDSKINVCDESDNWQSSPSDLYLKIMTEYAQSNRIELITTLKSYNKLNIATPLNPENVFNIDTVARKENDGRGFLDKIKRFLK